MSLSNFDIKARVTRTRDGLLAQLEILALFVGVFVLCLYARDAAFWLGATERGADIAAFCLWVFTFWMSAIWWMYVSFLGDQRRAAEAGENQK